MSENKSGDPVVSEAVLPLRNTAFYRGLREGIRLTLAALNAQQLTNPQKWEATVLERIDQRIAQTEVPESERSPAAIAAMLSDLSAIERGEAVGRDFEEFLGELAGKRSHAQQQPRGVERQLEVIRAEIRSPEFKRYVEAEFPRIISGEVVTYPLGEVLDELKKEKLSTNGPESA